MLGDMNDWDEEIRRVIVSTEHSSFTTLGEEYDWFVTLCDALEELGVQARVGENAHMEPRTETRTEIERSSRVVPTATGGVTRETTEREVEKTVTVGEKKVTTGFYVLVGDEKSNEWVETVSEMVGLTVKSAPAYTGFTFKLE